MSEQAWALADQRCRAAGVAVRPLGAAAEAHAAAGLLRTIWGGADTVLSANALVALAHAGNYAVGVYATDRHALIGVSVGWFCALPRRALHSHVTGLLDTERGRGVGTAVKLHQRAWALGAGLTTVTWTFDPLVARNAHFACTTLGARPARYLVNFYGPMTDAINAGDESDRFEAEWDLGAPWPPPAGGAGDPSDSGTDDALLVAAPADIEQLRHADPAAARHWRRRLREELLPLLDAGYAVTGFTADRCYVVRRAASVPGPPA